MWHTVREESYKHQYSSIVGDQSCFIQISWINLYLLDGMFFGTVYDTHSSDQQ